MKLAGLVLAAGLLAGCGSAASSVPATIIPSSSPATFTPAPAATAPAAPAPATYPVPAITHHRFPSGTHPPLRYPADWKLPDRKLSPGAVQPGYTIADICPHVNPALEAMRPSESAKEAVYRAYGITSRAPGQYEIDHVDAVELLGLVAAPPGDPALNLYPELNDTPDPAMIAKYHLHAAFIHNSKDILEDVLHQDVCDGAVPLAVAQHAIMTDWRRAYVAYVGPPPSHRPPAPPPPASAAPVPAAPAPPPSSHAAPAVSSRAPASCYPRTSGGSCYRAGEYCRTADRGTSGIAGSGERITCENRNGWRWEAS